jgi:hypothetical protein
MSEPVETQTKEKTDTPAVGQPPAAGVPFAPTKPALSQPAPDEQADANPPERRKNRVAFGGTDQRKNVVDRRCGLDRRVIDLG